MSTSENQEEVLVAILNKISDYEILLTKRWYRIPMDSVRKMLMDRWPPRWLAFYQTVVFGPDKYRIQYYAQVKKIRKVERRILFPLEETNEKSKNIYYKIEIEPLLKRTAPIISRKFRRVVFIQTTYDKFAAATELNDLFDQSPLEDRLWKEFKKRNIAAERQEFVRCKGKIYALAGY